MKSLNRRSDKFYQRFFKIISYLYAALDKGFCCLLSEVETPGDNGIGVLKRKAATLHSCCLTGEWFAGYNTNLVARCRILSNPWDKKTTVSDTLLHNLAP
jgi:hypothetical protein